MLESPTVRHLFIATVFLGSALLFLVQPMVAKMILPSFGGAPQVWSASMVFFQGSLLIGYLYAHLSVRWLGERRQSLLHVLLLALAGLTLPVSAVAAYARIAAGPLSGAPPSIQVLATLSIAVFGPFALLAAGAPLLQKWLGATDDPTGRDPYYLYVSSNVGSLLALLAYPLLLEPRLDLRAQSLAWSGGFAGLILLMAASAFALWRGAPSQAAQAPESAGTLAWGRRFRWTALAAVPSSLMLGVTSYLTTNIAPMPLLWVVPLSTYLLTFIWAFGKRRLVPQAVLLRILPILTIPLAIVMVLEATEPIAMLAIIHLSFFAAAALMCHRALAEDRPEPSHLTEFYLWISLGGALGGVFNGLLAPALFDSLAEYPIAIVAAILLRPSPNSQPFRRWDLAFPLAVCAVLVGAWLLIRATGLAPGPLTTLLSVGVPALIAYLGAERAVGFALSVGLLFLLSHALHTTAPGRVLLSERSFFGVHRVLAREEGDVRELVHGNTTHGRERRSMPGVPLTYYHRTGPIGSLMASLEGDPRRRDVALVGLGVGSIAAYGAAGDRFDFYEIDPVVASIAANPSWFTFLERSRARVSIILGDARLSLRQAPGRRYGLLILDAFSSDAIPVHLLTREALELYLAKLQPDGLVALHVSNRYLDLGPIVADTAGSLGLTSWIYEDLDVPDGLKREGKEPSVWMILARDPRALEGLASRRDWTEMSVSPKPAVWTDDYSNILQALSMD